MKILTLVVIAKQITVLDRAVRNSNLGNIIHKELWRGVAAEDLLTDAADFR